MTKPIMDSDWLTKVITKYIFKKVTKAITKYIFLRRLLKPNCKRKEKDTKQMTIIIKVHKLWLNRKLKY